MRFTSFLTALLLSATSSAAGLQASVRDARGKSVAEAVIVVTTTAQATSKSEAVTAAAATITTIMDQVEKRFVPEVLVVRAGTSVSFPNSDAVAHQVYSFSPAKQFALPLYRGRAHPPLIFDQPGVVVLGCNIHDQMVGYIYVTASPHFGKTDNQGNFTISGLAAGNYRITAWHPRFDEQVADREVKLLEAEPNAIEFRLQRPLRPAPRPVDSRMRDY